MNVSRKDDGGGGDHRWLVVQEDRLVHSELAYLKGHVHHDFILIITEQMQEPVHRVNWSREVQVKAELDEHFRLEVVDSLLVNVLLLFVGEEFKRELDAGSILLFHFCGQDESSCCEEAEFQAREIPVPNTDQVPVHNVHRCK